MDWEEAGKQKGQQSSGSGFTPQPESRGKQKKRKVIAIVVAVLVVLFVVSRISSCAGSSKNYDSWPTSGLAAQLPTPDSKKIDVMTNSDEKLYVSVDDFGKDKYSKYVDSCKEKGFTVDASNDTSKYDAYNSEGYHLEVSCYSTDMNITLDAPISTETISWPTSGPGALLPKPASDKGKVSSNSSSQFSVKVVNTTKDAYAAYVTSVSDAGFNVDFSKSDTNYSAKNAEGAQVYVKYEGNNTMSVSVSAAKDNTSSSSSASSSSSTSSASSTASSSSSDSSSSSSNSSSVASKIAGAVSSAASGAVSSDFKQVMDDYETFMNNYCDFLEKYNAAADKSSMDQEALDLLNQETEWLNKVNSMDQSSLSAADSAYYLAVTTRVQKRLLEVGA